MVIGIFGESCTGKSAIADALKEKAGAVVYTGKDYLKLAKSEAEAKASFTQVLAAGRGTPQLLLYVISEAEHLALLPEGALRVLVTADLDTIKERFARRMHGVLPPPVAAMLEKKHGIFDGERHDLHLSNDGASPAAQGDKILALCGK